MAKIQIPMLDLRRIHQSLEPELKETLVRVVNSSSFILGEEVERFEEEFAKYLGVKYAVGVGNGTDAITLSLLAAGIGAGDEVITTSLSAFPTTEAVLRTGAKPVYVDINSATFNIDSTKIEEVITKRTKAILPVHLYGLPADLGDILRIAAAQKLIVVEDCAQAHGARYAGTRVGAWGLAGCFSFFPSKNLGCMGDGGMVVTNEEEIANKVRALRNHGEEGGRFLHKYIGFNSRLDTIQAAVLRLKLKYLDLYNLERRRIADLYTHGLTMLSVLPPRTQERFPGEHVYHLYVIRTTAEKREPLREHLAKKGIKTAIHYPLPLYRQPAYPLHLSLPTVELLTRQIISLPLFPLMQVEEMEYVLQTIKEWKEKKEQ